MPRYTFASMALQGFKALFLRYQPRVAFPKGCLIPSYEPETYFLLASYTSSYGILIIGNIQKSRFGVLKTRLSEFLAEGSRHPPKKLRSSKSPPKPRFFSLYRPKTLLKPARQATKHSLGPETIS